MTRVWNLAAGPATLPESVLTEVQRDLLDYQGTGMSVMEMSHRSPEFQAIMDEAQDLLRELLDIPENYEVLFMQGGATLQFSAVPLNLAHGGKLGYLVDGSWGNKAYQEAHRLEGDKAVVLASSRDDHFRHLASPSSDIDLTGYDYVHFTSNNTIEGTEYFNLPNLPEGVELVSDMSSDFLSRPVDVSKFAVIYAGAQKNVGPAGVTIVIVRKDQIQSEITGCPVYLEYATHARKGSMYNTPPTFTIYVCMLVMRWIKAHGGVEGMEREAVKKSELLYQTIDQSRLFFNNVAKEQRSRMNIPFVTGDEDLDQDFIKACDQAGFKNIKGHRSVGGMRASIYNAFPYEGVQELCRFIQAFEKEH